jgi:hypothetical protein
MLKTGKWLELCRRACSEKEPLKMIELAQQAVELWDQEHDPAKKQSGSQSENENASGPPAHKLDGE